MSFLGFSKKKDKFHDISKKEKKEFLSNDFIDRMIRVEQTVSASLGESKSYSDTEYYNKLTKDEKVKFNKYLKNKKSQKIFFAVIVLMGILSVSIFNHKITGNVINSQIGKQAIGTISYILIGLIFIGLFLSAIFLASSKLKKRHSKRDADILKRILYRREFGNYF